MNPEASRHRGFTLVELVTAIAVLGIGVTLFLTLILQTVRDSPDPMLQVQAHAISQSYMEEILSQPFCDPDDFSGDCFAACTAAAVCSACGTREASRGLYDDVCDYAGLADDGAADFTGAVPGLARYNVAVVVDDADVTLGSLSSTLGQVVRIEVTVTHDSYTDLAVKLTSYKVNF